MMKSALIITSMSLLLLVGCASKPDNSVEPGYRTARAQSSLELPPDLITNSSATFKSGSAQSADTKVLPEIEGLEIKRNDTGERWLEVNASIDEVWAKLVDFTQKSSLPILSQSKSTAIIETDWIGNEEADGGVLSGITNFFDNLGGRPSANDKYTFWLERSGANNTSLFVNHRKLNEYAKDLAVRDEIVETAWIESKGDGFKALEMLRNLKTFFGGKTEANEGEQDITLITQGSPSIIVQDGIVITADRLKTALVESNYKIVSQNIKKGTFVVSDLTKKAGLFSTVTPRKRLRIQLRPYGEGENNRTQITILSFRGKEASSKKSLPVLYRLAEALQK